MILKLNMLPPSVNNMSVRVFVRAAGLPFEEENVWGQTGSDEYKAKVPSGLTPSIETEGLPKGAMWESCAVMMYLSSREGLSNLYPTDLERRAMVDSANFYTLSILYPLVARATYPRLSFSGYPGEVSTSEAVQEYEHALGLAGTPMTSHSAGLANALALSGRVGEAREMLAALSRRRAQSYVSPWALASIHARLGETEEALTWLERAYEEHDSTLVWLKVHPRFDALRSEPRFEALLARLGL